MKGQKLIAVIIGVLAISGALFFGGYNTISQMVRASSPEPHDVTIAATTRTNARITWTTDRETEGVVEYGTSPTSLGQFAVESKASKIHAIDLTLLSPGTTYYFQIRIGDKTYTNGGSPWTFSTAGSDAATPTPTPAQIQTPEQSSSCNDTDCEAMKEKFGKGCTTQDYFRCVRKVTPTP